jgi:hypothetical protein
VNELEEHRREDTKVPAPIVDLLKRHATLPSRQSVLSEAFEIARRLHSSGSRVGAKDASKTTES